MLPESDPRIESFRQTVKQLTSIPGILDTLGITIARADELPGLITQASYPLERQCLQEEQTAIGHPMTLRIQQAQLENELRQGLANIGESLWAAIDAAKSHVTTAAGGAEAVQKFPFACRHLRMLSRYRDPLPPTETIKLQLGLISAARWIIDAAMGSLDEIRYEAHQQCIITASLPPEPHLAAPRS
jgi:hypothetical protein